MVFPFLLGRAFIEVTEFSEASTPNTEEFPFLLGRAFIEVRPPGGVVQVERNDFPSFWEGLSLRCLRALRHRFGRMGFPFLLGRAFIEVSSYTSSRFHSTRFPFLLGRAFIEVPGKTARYQRYTAFPFLLGRAFIEVTHAALARVFRENFPSFWEGLSLRCGKEDRGRHLQRKFPFLLGRAFIEVAGLPY